MPYRLFTTEEFDKDFDFLDESEKSMVRKILNQLKEKGDDVGKPLKYPYFREKKFENKRLYFLACQEPYPLGYGVSRVWFLSMLKNCISVSHS